MNLYTNFIDKIRFNNNKIKRLFACIIEIVFLSLVFVAGSFNNSTDLEYIAEYTAEITRSHTNGGIYSSLIVEPKDETKSIMKNTSIEFYSLYGSFSENKASFVGAVNADKTHSIKFCDYPIESNISFIYAETGFSNIEYKDAWKHEYYPLQLMFKGIHESKNAFSFVYISQGQADIMLECLGLEKDSQNYRLLLNNNVKLEFDGIIYEWKIANIYLETNYFYDAIHEIMGDFLFGYNKYPDGFKKQAVYFMSDFPFQNQYYLEHANKNYSINDYDYKLGTFNIESNYKLKENIFERIPKDDVKSTFSILLIIFVSILDTWFLFLLWQVRYFSNKINLILFFISSLVPYIFFKMLFLFTNNVYFFSSVSTISNIIIMVVICFASFFIYLFTKKER